MSKAEQVNAFGATAASYQDFVDKFCQTMWDKPREEEIVASLKILFAGHQAKYGKAIVPDNQLVQLLHRARSLPAHWDQRDETDSFKKAINGPGWYTINNVVNRNELLIVAIMSLAVYNFSTIRNRHGWSVEKEKKQNR
jgi:hypothetical protein